MRNFIFIWIALLVIFAVGCGGGGTEPIADSNPGFDQMVKAPEITLDKIPNWNGDPLRGSQYPDPIPDVYSAFDFPIEWQTGWDRSWGGYSDSTFDKWCLIFDYGDPVEGDNYHWMNAVMVYGQFNGDTEDNWYMHFTFTDDVDFPGFPASGYDDASAFYGFADAAVHIDYDDRMPSQVGKFDYKFDLTSEDADGKVPYSDYGLIPSGLYLPLFDGGKKGTEIFDPAANGGVFDIAIHATVTYIDYFELFDEFGDPLVPAQFDHEYFGDDTGWGTGCLGKDSALFTMVEDKGYKAWNPGTSYGINSYWKVEFMEQDWFPWPSPDANPFGGWCTDPSTMYNGGYPNTTHDPYVVDVYSCYDTANLPNYAMSDHWDLISWILNERMDPDSVFYDYHYKYTQRAIWYFKYGNAGGMADTTGGAGVGITLPNTFVDALIDAAKANGENYYPGEGEYFAAILFPANSDGESTAFQMNIIAVDP